MRVREVALQHRIAEATSRLRQLDTDPQSDPDQRRQLGQALYDLQRQRAALREEAQ